MLIVWDKRNRTPIEWLDTIKSIDYIKKWKQAADALGGDGGYVSKTYLMPFKRETDEGFKERQKSAKYINIIGKKLTRYVGYVFKIQPSRQTDNELLSLIIDDATGSKEDIQSFIVRFAHGAKIRGAGAVLVDMPETIPETMTDQIEKRSVPFFKWIEPERVSRMVKDDYGTIIESGFYDIKDDKLIERVYYTDSWEVLDRDGMIIDAGLHNAGRCPMVFFGEDNTFPSVGEFTTVGDICIELFNLRSELREILRDQTFSILTLQARSPQDVELKIGTDNAIVYGEGMNPPAFIAADARNAETYQNDIDKLEAKISDIMYDIQYTGSVESGIALDIKFQGLNASLSKFAALLESFEKELWQIAANYLNITNNAIQIVYNKDFSIKDIEKEILELGSIKNMGYDIPALESEKLKDIASNMIDADNEILTDVYEQIDIAVQSQDAGEPVS